MLSNLLSDSRMRVARRCFREHHFQYELGYRPVETAEELAFGALFHGGLEAWWGGALGKAPKEGWLSQAIAALRGAKADPFQLVAAEVLMHAYHARWADEPYEVLAVELPFRTSVVNPETKATSRTWDQGGKLDAVVRRTTDGVLMLVEHKTSSEDVSMGSTYWKRLRINGQVSTYYDGAAAKGFEVEETLYDVIGKPAQRPLLATPMESRKHTKDGRLYANQRAADETPEEYRARVIEAVLADPNRYLTRGTVVRLEQELDEARADTWQLGRVLRENQLAGRAPRNPDACSRYGRMCPFFPVCTNEASLDDTRLYVRSDNVHPELPEQPAAEQSTGGTK